MNNMKNQPKSLSFHSLYSLAQKYKGKSDRPDKSHTNIARVGVIALGILLFPLVTTAKAITIRNDTSDQSYVTLGNQYSSVGKITTSNSVASGVLIGSNWVLTAAHVVKSATNIKFVIGGQTLTTSNAYFHPLWNGNPLAGNDIGLIQLSTGSSIAPAQIYGGTKGGIVGQMGTFTGYGLTGTGITGYKTTLDGKKRGAQNTIEASITGLSTSAVDKLFFADFDNPITSTAQSLEGLIAPGDSGGGDFVNVNGTNYLVGINSFVGAFDGNINSSYGDFSGHTFIPSYMDWINTKVFPTITTTVTSITVKPTNLQATPEPLTILGTMTALGFGVGFKRKLSGKNIHK